MDAITIILLGIGLAMDAFAVSICKGLAMGKARLKAMVIIGLWFGFFQAIMPAIGYFVGKAFYDLISEYDHWVAFILLALIGGNMLREALFGEEEDVDADIGFKIMLLLAIATSIDALAVGISMAMDGGDILVPVVSIGVITMALSMVGVKIGSLFGDRFGSKAEILGGIILIGIGLKILLEGLGIF
ncbi:MAG: manganese efflux pump MntP family protein [archaeon]|nr:manganese efflux pump MntP family protein [archaeon]